MRAVSILIAVIFPLFLLVPSTSTIPPEKSVLELEAILARPAFAKIGSGYFDRKARGAKFVARNREWWFQSYNPGIRFARPSGRIASLERYESDFPSHSETPLSTERLIALAKEVRDQFQPNVAYPHVEHRLVGDERFLDVFFRRDLDGFPIDSPMWISLDRATGELQKVRLWPDVDVLAVDTRRFLPKETLRGLALGGYSRIGAFPQADLVKDEVSIAIYEDPDFPKRDEFGELEGVHRPISQLHMIFIDPENGERREIMVDAITGRVSVSELMQPFGRSSLRPSPLPTKVACGKIAGTLTALSSSGTPSGVAAFVHEADRYFAGRYETKTGTLWLQRTKKEPYRAFRPDARLRKALAEQVKRIGTLEKR